MTWKELYERIPEERRNDQVHLLDEDPGVLDWGNISLKTKRQIVADDHQLETSLASLTDGQYVLVFES